MVYVDSSVILRFVLEQPEALTELLGLEDRVTSAITEVECLRGVEAARERGLLTPDEAAERRREVYAQVRRMKRLLPSPRVLRRAGGSFPATLKTLDALHLASALALADRSPAGLSFATHDRQLARAARAVGLEVLGA